NATGSAQDRLSVLLSSMIFRIFAAALCAVLIFPASAQTPDLAAIARSSGTPEIPGLKMVWLAPWGDVAKAHPWKNISVHRTEGPAGRARDRREVGRLGGCG